MPFPAPPQRVRYDISPIEQAVCQFQFPADLRIDTELPAAFQGRLRNDFPNFTAATEVRIEFTGAPEGLREMFQSSAGKNYALATADGSWQVNLTRTFISLTTKAYRTWEDFKGILMLPLDAFVEIYRPSHFSRIGLRYVDVFRRSKIGLSAKPWRDLLTPALIGILGSTDDVANSVGDFVSTQELRLSDQGEQARVITKFTKGTNGQEETFTIDSDFFDTARTETGQTATRKLDSLHSHASSLFHWAITELLHKSMRPLPK
jgi:uncharacterized protein (TIGR04255 family)